MDHFMNPRHTGDLAAPCGEGWSGPTNRGYFMRIQVCLEDQHVVEARFATFGCVPAIAAGSLITDWVRGRTIDEARVFTAPRLAKALGGLPESRRFCADLAVDALHAALADATSRSGVPGPVGGEPVEVEGGGHRA